MLMEGLTGLGLLIGYYATAASLTLLLKRLLNIPQEPTRKMLHIACVLSVFIPLYAVRTWYAAAATLIAFAVLVYPILLVAERFPLYGSLLAERKGGEVKTSLVIVSLMMTVLIAVFWGWFGAGSKYIIVAAVMAWGFGDAAAALIGKRHGRHYLEGRLIEGRKTVEGTLAMYAVSWLATFVTTMAYAVQPWYLCLIIALLVAPVCAIVELFSRWGSDTITVPFSAAITAFTLVSLFAHWGVGVA